MRYDKITFAIELDDNDAIKIMNKETLLKEIRMDRPTYATFEYGKDDLIEIRPIDKRKKPLLAKIKDDPVTTVIKDDVKIILVLEYI